MFIYKLYKAVFKWIYHHLCWRPTISNFALDGDFEKNSSCLFCFVLFFINTYGNWLLEG